MKLETWDVIVAFLSAAVCLCGLINVPAWAVFIGWTWYLTLGSSKDTVISGVLTAVPSAALALIAIFLTDILTPELGATNAGLVAVFLMILLLMQLMKMPRINGLVSFNAFTCIFAGYYLGAFPAQESYLLNFGAAWLYITGANIFGLVVGVVSIALKNTCERFIASLKKSDNRAATE